MNAAETRRRANEFAAGIPQPTGAPAPRGPAYDSEASLTENLARRGLTSSDVRWTPGHGLAERLISVASRPGECLFRGDYAAVSAWLRASDDPPAPLPERRTGHCAACDPMREVAPTVVIRLGSHDLCRECAEEPLPRHLAEPERCDTCGQAARTLRPWALGKRWCASCEARFEDELARDRALERA